MRPKGREDSYTLARQSSADPDGMCHKSPAQQQTGITEQLLTEVECSHSKFLQRKVHMYEVQTQSLFLSWKNNLHETIACWN